MTAAEIVALVRPRVLVCFTDELCNSLGDELLGAGELAAIQHHDTAMLVVFDSPIVAVRRGARGMLP